MSTKLVGRVFLVVGLCVLVVLFASEMFGEELSIVEVRRNIPLADTDPIYKDFYINSGKNEGLKVGSVVSVTRKLSIKDATGTQIYGEAVVPVGQLKIIFVADKIAIAREHKLLPREALPMLEQTSIMVGDKIEKSGSSIAKE
jgi:hypothetical protein